MTIMQGTVTETSVKKPVIQVMTLVQNFQADQTLKVDDELEAWRNDGWAIVHIHVASVVDPAAGGFIHERVVTLELVTTPDPVKVGEGTSSISLDWLDDDDLDELDDEDDIVDTREMPAIFGVIVGKPYPPPRTDGDWEADEVIRPEPEKEEEPIGIYPEPEITFAEALRRGGFSTDQLKEIGNREAMTKARHAYNAMRAQQQSSYSLPAFMLPEVLS